jgi:quercetin dioxygenase-like cupin family protein
MSTGKSTVLAAAFALLPAMILAQANPKPTTKPGTSAHPMAETITPDKLTWSPIQPEGFDPGLELTVVRGNPNATTGSYVARLKLPNGYKFPAHWHPMTENVTVLEGELSLGMGSKPDDAKLMTYPTGSYLYLPAHNVHFGQVKGTTVLQLTGSAPFKIMLAK